MIYNWLIKHKKSAYGIAIGFLIFTILIYAFRSCWFFRPLYEYIDYWALPLSAAFMLVLAYMAYISITEDRRIRAEDIERQHRARSLNEIRDWAEKALSLIAPARWVVGTVDPYSSGYLELLQRLGDLEAEEIAIRSNAELFGEQLSSAVKTAFDSLKAHTTHLLSASTSEEAKKASREALAIHLSTVLKWVFKVKAELKL